MGELFPPTAADYAASNARDALNQNKELKERVDKLEKLVNTLTQRLVRLEILTKA